MITLTLNGRTVQTEGGTVLDAAKAAGIHIPTLCHHPMLAPQGACRLCLVEVKGFRTLQPACYLPAADGMEVQTDTPKVRGARKFVLELLVSDHPADCMTCEMCGSCELQDLVYEYGVRETPFKGEKHRYPLDERDPFILRDMEKCIRCRRCVRACDEIQAVNAITMINRGYRSKVAAPFDVPLQESVCIFCGQCISVCPTGALTEKDSAHTGRAWQVTKVTTTCAYCGVGCNFDLNVRDGKVVKVTSNWQAPANKGVLCVKGRFGWQFLNNPDRLTKPLVKASVWKAAKGTDGTPAAREGYVEASWDDALDIVAAGLDKVRRENGPDAVGVLSSAKCTNEENYLMQKMVRSVIGTNNIDHCARL